MKFFKNLFNQKKEEKKLLIGLGNIGDKYRHTRHNVGFMFLDYFKETVDASDFKEESKFKSEISTNSKFILLKPTTYMNKSGEAAVLTKNYYSINNKNIVVIHDDLDIQFGEFKIQKEKGPRGHNGIASVENHLRYKDFWRIRIGVEGRVGDMKNIPGKDYVLSKFNIEEMKQLENIFSKIIESEKFKNIF